MPPESSSVYAGKVMHQRLRPRRHRLSYRMFSLLLDVDEIGTLASSLRLFSHNRFNLFSFFDGDHGDGSGRPLREHVEHHLGAGGIDFAGGAIRLLAMPRMLGYAFNPLSVYFCHHRDGALVAILYEVNNTFGERHSYLIPIHEGDVGDHQSRKAFHVSPFMGMDMNYRFRVQPPAEKLSIHITGSDDAGPVLYAAFSANREPLTDQTLARIFFAYPLLTMKVMAGIHWEALLMVMKGLRLKKRPRAPANPVSYVAASHWHQKAAPDVVET